MRFPPPSQAHRRPQLERLRRLPAGNLEGTSEGDLDLLGVGGISSDESLGSQAIQLGVEVALVRSLGQFKAVADHVESGRRIPGEDVSPCEKHQGVGKMQILSS